MAIDPNWVRENPEEAARQIDLLTIERDQYRAAEEAQIELREKAAQRVEELTSLCNAAGDEIIKAGKRFLELDGRIEFLNKQNAAQQEQNDLLVAHIMAAQGLVVGHRMRGMFSTSGPAFSRLMLEWYETAPTASVDRRDEIKKAEGAVDFVTWLEKECERNGEVGEIVGMTLSGITGESRAAPNLRAARMIFAEAKKMAEWKLGQAVVVKS